MHGMTTHWREDTGMAEYVYIFDCVDCGGFYGEQKLDDDGKLYCPECRSEQWKDSDYVERMKVS